MRKSESDPSYEPEAQAFGVMHAEREGRLTIIRGSYYSRERVQKEKLEWVIFRYTHEGQVFPATLLGLDCNDESMKGLRFGSPVIVIQDHLPQPQVFDGRDFMPVAAVLTGKGRVIYRSGIFNLGKFIEKYQDTGETSRKNNKWFL